MTSWNFVPMIDERMVFQSKKDLKYSKEGNFV